MEQETQLVEATQDDIDTFIALERRVSGTKTYSPILEREEALKEFKSNKIFLVKKGGVTVGTVMYELKNENHVYISGLVIDPDLQGQGIGRAVVILLLERLKTVSRIDLVTHPENKAALSLYTSLGFTVESRKENYFNDGEPRLVLVKSQ